MKGLLLKEFYMLRHYCRTYLLIIFVFVCFSFINSENLFFVFYPCMIAGIIPITLLGYDEQSKWHKYSHTLPYTKAHLVSAKYILGLFLQIFVLLLTGIVQAIRMYTQGTFILTDYAILMTLLLIISCITSSISLPFMFKLGVEKGRMAYYIMIGFVCASSVIASSLFQEHLQTTITWSSFIFLLAIASIAIYICSWYLSIVFYIKREIS